MSGRLPPLNALKTLEAAGRHMSFTRAAAELHVTPGAISRQIRTLEDLLGFPLFERNHRDVQLSPEGKAYVESLGDSFRQMERATQRLIESRRHQPLYVHTAITFTLRWLMPRLVAFHARHPRQEFRLSTVIPDPEELAASTHVALQIRSDAILAGMPGLIGHRLMDIELVPVCSPALLATGALDGDPLALQNHTLLHSFARRKDWAAWLDAMQLGDVDPHGGIVFESSSLAYQAALDGIGIAMGMRGLVEGDLQAGRLVTPHSFALRSDTGFYLVYGHAAARLASVIEFRDWILGDILGDAGPALY